MNKANQFKTCIHELFRGGKTLDLTYFTILDNLDYAALLQAVRHHAEAAFVYKINAVQGAGRDYRSAELFPSRATQLYSGLAPFSDTEIGVVRTLELWILEDFSFAVVANMEIVVGEGAIVSEYRTIKTQDPNEIHNEIGLNLTTLAKNLRDMCQDYLKADLPSYEL